MGRQGYNDRSKNDFANDTGFWTGAGALAFSAGLCIDMCLAASPLHNENWNLLNDESAEKFRANFEKSTSCFQQRFLAKVLEIRSHDTPHAFSDPSVLAELLDDIKQSGRFQHTR
eukprot:2147284-Amphidinium_carterae.1